MARVVGIVFPLSLAVCLTISAAALLGLPAEQRTLNTGAQITLQVLLFGYVGCGGLGVAIGHALRERQVAEAIGWPAGNPFHYELSAATLGFAVLGLLTRWYGPEFWTAAAIGISVFQLGAGGVHLTDRIASRKMGPLGGIAIVAFDFFAPVLLLGTLVVYYTTLS
ncbi:MAG TPA: DUF6790 family protein [Chloroflexota bacterium]|jgi:hypothetical protein